MSTEHLPEERRKLKEITSQFDPADVYMTPNQTLTKRRNAGGKLAWYMLLSFTVYGIML